MRTRVTPSAVLRVLLLVFSLDGLATAASATTFVMAPDALLVEQADAIAFVRVGGAAPGSRAGTISTEYSLQVENVLKGELPDGARLRVPGGEGQNGLGLKVYGAPQFREGEGALLFLTRNADGSYSSLHLMLGAFHLFEVGERRIALRDLDDARQLGRDAGGKLVEIADSVDLPRDAVAFAAWIREAAAGAFSTGNYFVPESELRSSGFQPRYAFLIYQGHRIRWFDFDAGRTINWQAQSSGQLGLPGGGFAEVQQALRAWTNDAGSRINYNYSGQVSSNVTGCDVPARTGRAVWGDPNDDINNDFSCEASAGVLALGGPCFNLDLQPYRGQDYHATVSAYFVTNIGFECYLAESGNAPVAAAEVFAHEVGHTLGLGHTSVSSALMFANAHNDGRGASLHPDDRAAVAEIYATDEPPPPPPTPNPPSNLSATTLSTTSIRINWQDNSGDETGFRVERRVSGGAYSEIATVGANVTTHTSTGLLPGTTYDFRVRSRNAAGSSAFSNVASATTEDNGLAAPAGLALTVLSTSQIRLNWTDNASAELSYRVERKLYGDFQEIANLPPGSTSYTSTGLESASPYQYRVRAAGAGAEFSPYSSVVGATTRGIVGACVPNATTLCLLGGAIRVQVVWRTPSNGAIGDGQTIPLAEKTGAFWFFNADNVELLVKALDGGGINGRYWIFYGALSDVEYWVRATATASGDVAVYRNVPGDICGGADTAALPKPNALTSGESAPLIAASRALELVDAAAPALAQRGSCVADSDTLCLLGGRFAVSVDWRVPSTGATGIGHPVAEGDRTGYFWFFNNQNYELVTKALDGTSLNGKLWFFYGALSDVEYHIRVTDTVRNTTKTYDNPAGEICGRGDTGAFSP